MGQNSMPDTGRPRQLHCKRGHPLEYALRVIRGKYEVRHCRECGRLRQRQHREVFNQPLPLRKASRRLATQPSVSPIELSESRAR